MSTLKLLLGPSVTMRALDPCTSARALTSASCHASRTFQVMRIRFSGLPEILYSPADRSIAIRPLVTNSRSMEPELLESCDAPRDEVPMSAVPARAAARIMRMGHTDGDRRPVVPF